MLEETSLFSSHFFFFGNWLGVETFAHHPMDRFLFIRSSIIVIAVTSIASSSNILTAL